MVICAVSDRALIGHVFIVGSGTKFCPCIRLVHVVGSMVDSGVLWSGHDSVISGVIWLYIACSVSGSGYNYGYDTVVCVIMVMIVLWCVSDVNLPGSVLYRGKWLRGRFDDDGDVGWVKIDSM